MVTVARDLPHDVEAVFAVIADPRTYPHWLVGAREMRAVDADWPSVGSQFHHRVGLVGPLKVADSSEVLAVDPPRLLDLEARARPFGRAQATFRLTTSATTDATPTHLELEEVPLGALHHLSWALDPLTAVRNRRSLEQLADFLATGRSHRAPG